VVWRLAVFVSESLLFLGVIGHLATGGAKAQPSGPEASLTIAPAGSWVRPVAPDAASTSEVGATVFSMCWWMSRRESSPGRLLSRGASDHLREWGAKWSLHFCFLRPVVSAAGFSHTIRLVAQRRGDEPAEPLANKLSSARKSWNRFSTTDRSRRIASSRTCGWGTSSSSRTPSKAPTRCCEGNTLRPSPRNGPCRCGGR